MWHEDLARSVTDQALDAGSSAGQIRLPGEGSSAVRPRARPLKALLEKRTMSAPIRHKIEPGIYERVSPSGERLGLEIAWKDSDGRTRRRTVKGDIHAARDELAKARTRRAATKPNPPTRE